MKNIFTIIAALLFTNFGFAQSSFEITFKETNPWGDAYYPLVSRAHVKNTSGTSKNVKAKRVEISLVSGTHNYFCWDVCYDTTNDISVNTLAIPAGDTTEAFYGDYEANGIAGVSTIKYCFYDQQNQADSICYIAVFGASPTGIGADYFAEGNKVSAAFPNPATGITRITYSVKHDAGAAKLVLHNMLGALVKTIDLNEKLATLEISVSELQSGIYFYSLVVDDKTIATKKLVVSK